MKLRARCIALSPQDEEVILQNPADVPVFVQVLPLALLPNPSVFSGKLADRWGFSKTPNMRPSSSSKKKRRYSDLSLSSLFYFPGCH